MKAVAVWPAQRRVGMAERAAPTLGSDTSVRFRVLEVGVCGTDAEICGFHYGGTPPHGFLVEEAVEEERNLVPLAADLRGVGVLTEPLTIAEKGLRQFLQVRRRLPWLDRATDDEVLADRHALVLGAGPVELLGCMLLRLRGLRVTVYSRGASRGPRAALVESLGGTYLSSSEVPTSELASKLGGVDLIYEAAGASQLAFDSLERLGADGVFVFTGVPGRKHRIQVAGDAIMRNLVLWNQTLLGTVNAGRIDFEAAARDLGRIRQAWPGALESLITGRHPMEEFCRRAGGDGIRDLIALSEAG